MIKLKPSIYCCATCWKKQPVSNFRKWLPRSFLNNSNCRTHFSWFQTRKKCAARRRKSATVMKETCAGPNMKKRQPVFPGAPVCCGARCMTPIPSTAAAAPAMPACLPAPVICLNSAGNFFLKQRHCSRPIPSGCSGRTARHGAFCTARSVLN